MSQPTILLSSLDLRTLMSPADYLKAVENGFVAARKGRASSSHPMHIPVPLGGFHAKGAQLTTGRSYVALKLNGNLPGNLERTGLPTIQGALLLCDAETGAVLFLKLEHVSPGCFIAAVGADSASKGEITPQLMERATVVVDSLDQCLAMGDLRLAIASSALSSTDVYGDLGELADGSKPGRTREDEITVFDSTGTAIEDVASAAMVYERAVAARRGVPFVFSQ
jgi:ornithine cyclodeaminase/alanine dehydrogenase-like protein (mu-crystallin family)